MKQEATIDCKGRRSRERHVFFKVGETALSGIMALPENGAPVGAFLLSHGWAGNRNGPANLLTALARSLAAQGFATLRFDYRGRGESGGDGISTTLATMAADLEAAAAFLRNETGFGQLSILGMCSGGNVAIGALPRLGRLECMLLLSVYPFSDGDSFGRDIKRSRHFLAAYLRKACSLENWRRVLTGDASLGRVFKVIFRPFLKRGENKAKEGAMRQSSAGTLVKAASNESRKSDGPAPVRHLANLRADLPTLMIYGTGDPDADAAMKYFGDYAREKRLPVSFQRIEGANHNYSSQEWQQELLDHILAFIEQQNKEVSK